MKKKIATTLLALTLSLNMVVPALAGTISINVNGINRVFNDVQNINGTTIVNGDDLADRIEVSYIYDEETGAITMANSDTTLIMHLDSLDATVNGSSVTLPVAPTKNENGVIQLPLRFIAETFGYNVSFDGNTNLVTLSNNSPYVSNFGTYDDITENTTIYTYDEAVAKAIKNSSLISSAEREFDELEDTLENIDDTITNGVAGYTTIGGYTYFSEGAVRTMIINRDNLITALSLKDDSLESIETAVELNLLGSLIALESTKVNYELKEQALGLKETELNNAKTKYSLGMISADDLRTAQSAYDKAKLDLDASSDSIDAAKRDVNSAMGLSLTADTYVEFDTTINYNDYKNLDEEDFVKDVLRNSMTLKQAQANYDTVKKSTAYITDTDDYYTKYRNLDAAQENLDNTKKSVEESARATFESLTGIVNNDKILRKNREDLINQYNSAVILYNTGYTTEYALQQLENAITSVEASILLNELSYKATIFQIEHPELI